MNLQQLRYFTVLAEVGHFGRASEALHITQPALSNSIKNLEKELGFDLFDRTGQGVMLTPLGVQFNAHIIKALGEIDKAVSLPQSSEREPPFVRIGTVASVQKAFLPSLIIDYEHAAHRNAKFDIIEVGSTFDCLSQIKDNKLDLAFCGYSQDAHDGVVSIPVLPQRLVAAVSPAHSLAYKESISLNELSDFPLISYRKSSGLHRSVEAVAGISRIRFREAFHDEIGAVSQIAANPQCVALLLDTTEGKMRTAVRFLPIDELDFPFHMVGATYRQASLGNEEVMHFVNYLEKRFKPLTKVVTFESTLSLPGGASSTR